MYVRKRLDASYRDLLKALMFCLKPDKSREGLSEELCQIWSNRGDALTAFSVRTALDAWLSTLTLPKGSEVVMTGINIPDMVYILEHHDLKIVPVDLDLETLEIESGALENAITPKTRIVLIAHLFGTRTSMNPIFKITSKYTNILVAEDCAQAFSGMDGYFGDDRSDISLFSFGAIKTATALGGAMFRIRNPEQRQALSKKLAEHPKQRRAYFAKKIIKYTLLKTLTLRPVYDLFIRVCQLASKDFDEIIISSVRGFNSKNLINLIRQQPCTAQLSLLKRRLIQYSSDKLDQRRRTGSYLNRALPRRLRSVGSLNKHHTWWLFAVSIINGKALVEELREAGFDATTSSTQLCAMPSERGAIPTCEQFMEGVVYLPVYDGVPEKDLNRMTAILHERPALFYREVKPEPALASMPSGK